MPDVEFPGDDGCAANAALESNTAPMALAIMSLVFIVSSLLLVRRVVGTNSSYRALIPSGKSQNAKKFLQDSARYSSYTTLKLCREIFRRRPQQGASPDCQIREVEASGMPFSGKEIAIMVLAGLAAGLLPSAITDRKGWRPAGDIVIAMAIVFAGYWLATGWRDFIPGFLEKQTAIVKVPNYEPVIFPLAPLRPLLKPIIPRSREEICDSVTAETRKHDIPAAFFIRLLYQESRFRPEAISSSGALGIAQFTPETAADRRLDNPFDPLQAIPASARLLRDLQRKFGNLGLAAAAYNAGPKRVQDWIANKTPLPQETQDYVKTITGRPVETWIAAETGSPALKLPRAAPCQETVGLLAWSGPDQIPMPPARPQTTAAAGPAQNSTPLLAKGLRAVPVDGEVVAAP
jgi:transglycosylase-like protein with SLT domain